MVEDGNNDGEPEPNDEEYQGDQPIPVIISKRQATYKPSNKAQNKTNVITIKRSNKLMQALNLPTIMNVNPRSIYNKKQEFHKFVEEESIDCIFMSESWERPENPLNDIINLPNHTVISNPHQRKGVGGRPALIINNSKYHIRNLTQTLIEIPWGVEATWAIISPKEVTNDSKIKRIALCSLYSKPDSRKKSLLIDHINHAFNLISTKYSGMRYWRKTQWTRKLKYSTTWS